MFARGIRERALTRRGRLSRVMVKRARPDWSRPSDLQIPATITSTSNVVSVQPERFPSLGAEVSSNLLLPLGTRGRQKTAFGRGDMRRTWIDLIVVLAMPRHRRKRCM